MGRLRYRERKAKFIRLLFPRACFWVMQSFKRTLWSNISFVSKMGQRIHQYQHLTTLVLETCYRNVSASSYRVRAILNFKIVFIFNRVISVKKKRTLDSICFSIDDGDGSEKITFKMNSRFFKLMTRSYR